MALVDTSTLLAVADRAAKQYWFIDQAFTQLIVAGTHGLYSNIVTTTENQQLEITTQGPYYLVDTGLTTIFAVRNGTNLSSIIGAMNAHFNTRDAYGNPLQVGGWDGYLYDHSCRVSWYFNCLFAATQGLRMLAVNVFSESTDVFGTVGIVAGPVISFTDGVNYGNGAIINPANGTYYAATQLKIVVVAMGGTNASLRLAVKDVNDNPTTIDVTVPGGSAPGTEISVGSSSDRFLDVMNVTFVPAGSTGTVGDSFTINNKKERQISL